MHISCECGCFHNALMERGSWQSSSFIYHIVKIQYTMLFTCLQIKMLLQMMMLFFVMEVRVKNVL